MSKKPLLGSLKDRVKTDVYLTRDIRDITDSYAVLLGVPRNAVVTLALAHFALRFSPILSPTQKRGLIIKKVEDELGRLLEEIKKQS